MQFVLCTTNSIIRRNLMTAGPIYCRC